MSNTPARRSRAHRSDGTIRTLERYQFPRTLRGSCILRRCVRRSHTHRLVVPFDIQTEVTDESGSFSERFAPQAFDAILGTSSMAPVVLRMHDRGGMPIGSVSGGDDRATQDGARNPVISTRLDPESEPRPCERSHRRAT